jgi:hypothetical protein
MTRGTWNPAALSGFSRASSLLQGPACAEPPLGLSMGPKQKRGGLWADLIPSQRVPLGAGLPAKVVNDDAPCLNESVLQTFFASKLAPTGKRLNHRWPLPQEWICTRSTKHRSAVRPPSPAGQLPQFDRSQPPNLTGVHTGAFITKAPRYNQGSPGFRSCPAGNWPC